MKSVAIAPVLASAVFGAAVWTGFPLCPSASVFGWPCPGCGLVRATLALFSGDVSRAVHFHPLVLIVAPLVIILAARGGWRLFGSLRGVAYTSPLLARFDPLLVGRAARALGTALLAALIGIWAFRFAGWFGGPVPVESAIDWWQHHVRHGS
jgi:hypothetical protein